MIRRKEEKKRGKIKEQKGETNCGKRGEDEKERGGKREKGEGCVRGEVKREDKRGKKCLDRGVNTHIRRVVGFAQHSLFVSPSPRVGFSLKSLPFPFSCVFTIFSVIFCSFLTYFYFSFVFKSLFKKSYVQKYLAEHSSTKNRFDRNMKESVK